MMSTRKTSPTDFVAEWVTTHLEALGGFNHKFRRCEGRSRKFCGEFETPKYLVQISAWDHACCLDILAVHKETGRPDYSVQGDCEGEAGLAQRLSAFLHWLNASEPRRDAP
jgi:hypothetical protein